jgi:hypothetical protein
VARGTVKATIFDQHPDVEIDLDEALKALEAEAPPFDGGGDDYTGEFVDLQRNASTSATTSDEFI